MNRIALAFAVPFVACVIACSGVGNKPSTSPATSGHHTDHDDASAEEARARWLADARAAKKTELERLATEAEAKAVAARQAYKKGYNAQLAYAKQQTLKKEAESLEAEAKRAREAVASADTYEPPPPANDHPVAAVGHSNGGGGAVHVKGYHRKDGTYVPPHTRSAPRR
jgi:hypothetical protein